MHRTILLSALVLCLVFLGGSVANAKKPARDSALVELGRRLFMDPAVSRNGQFSCADCHSPEHGFSDPRVVSEDENGKTRRHSQTLIDLQDDVGMHWDGEFDRVRELLVARLATSEAAVSQANELHTRHFNKAHSGGLNPNQPEYKKKLRVLTPPYYGPQMDRRAPAPRPVPVSLRLDHGGLYDEGFRRAFGSPEVSTKRVLDAVEAYVLSIRSGLSPFDRFAKGDTDALGESARRGLELFKGKANCASCHSGPDVEGRIAFTDNIYRNTGVAFKSVRMDFQQGFVADGGLGMMSFVEKDLGKFKTPTLRDVARRPPYMHDGSLKTLREVVRYYDKGGTANAGLHENIKPLKLTDQEVDDLVSFLKSLTSEERPGLGKAAGHRPSRTRIRVVNIHGKPMRNLPIELRSSGDRLQGAPVRGVFQRLETDSLGWVSFKFPRWTHVKLTAPGHEIGEDRPVPDYVKRATFVATPKSKISLRVIGPKAAMMPARIKAAAPVRNGGGLKREVVFTRVRRLGAGDALYVAPAGKLFSGERKVFGRHTVRLSFTPGGTRSFLRVIDLSGGATETLDLRPEK